MKESKEKGLTENEIAKIVVDAVYCILNGLPEEQP